MDIGSALRAARDSLPLSRGKLAKSLEVDSSTIYRIEMGTISPNVRMLERIADALGHTLEIKLLPKGKRK
jgi:transcriptional regulator with XRE-family HTH domain